MIAKSLEQAAKKASIEIKVETQGSLSQENKLNPNDIKTADFVILTTNIVGKDRFKGKKVIQMSAIKIIEKSDALMRKLQTIYKN